MNPLSQEQIESFQRDGCVFMEEAVSPRQLAAMQAAFARYVEESRKHAEPFGAQLDGRPRFDIEPGHSPDYPALRRVASPTELDEIFLEALTDSPMIEAVAQLLGPDLRLHHSKINSKLPRAATTVKWHQDFNFDPHSNDDVLTALVFLDEVTPENGPLRTVPGSHKGPLYSHWQNGRFTGTIAERFFADFEDQAVEHGGPAGSACLMHARTVHGSRANTSEAARTLFIPVIAAADALPLAPNPLPSRHEGLLLRGKEPGRVRASAFDMELPEPPTGASFFNQQEAS
jgi:ectoine hydroxylase-related dioxygenase (phytanoyl-CoA dioxygenase family)